MNQSRIEVVADALAVAWREAEGVPPVAGDLMPADLQEAWRIQDALDERLTTSS